MPTSSNETLMFSLLTALRDQGPLNADEITRLCLTPERLHKLMPESERQRCYMGVIEGMIALLDEDGTETAFVEALQQFKESEYDARQAMRWEQLPPSVHHAALRAARKLTDEAASQDWIEPIQHEGKAHWQITAYGGAALDRLKRE